VVATYASLVSPIDIMLVNDQQQWIAYRRVMYVARDSLSVPDDVVAISRTPFLNKLFGAVCVQLRFPSEP
jgi:hypothetical protein